MRVLVLADVCNPEWPSLPVVAYKAARAIAEHVNVVVVTHIRNRPNIEKAGFGRVSVRYVDTEYIANPTQKFSSWLRKSNQTALTASMALSYPSHLAFEWEAWKATKDELQRSAFDLVHRLTPMSPTAPSPMAKWSPIPFILGPLNGGLPWPRAFRRELAREGEWLSYVRGGYRLLPYYRSTYRDASAILAGFDHTIADLPRRVRGKTINFPEVGIDPDLFKVTSQKTVNKEKIILFVGRLVPYKLPQVVVRAFAERPALHAHRLLLVGDGPERSAIEQLVNSYGLQDRVTLLGWKSQDEVAALMQQADIFAFPSIRELGAGALLEAMASGLACVVVDYGAPASLISAGRGLKVPMNNVDQITNDFGQAIEQLAADTDRVRALGLAAHRHAMTYYSWDRKSRKMIEVYEWALGQRDKPDFWSETTPAYPEYLQYT